MSRRVVAGLFHSLDGVVSEPNLFQFDSFDADLGRLMGEVLGPVDEVVMGRKGYQQWAAYWPGHNDPDDFGPFINPIRKHVASRTLTQADLTWENSHLIEGDLLDFVRRLKEADGGDISVQGSISVVRQLFLAGLLDRLTLITHPVIAGAGERLFGPETPTTRLRLLDHEVTTAGNVVVTYGLRAS